MYAMIILGIMWETDLDQALFAVEQRANARRWLRYCEARIATRAVMP